jgi:hypothetical protein
MFVLGRLYYVYIPWLADLYIMGAVILSVGLILFFLLLGWIYDEKLKMWNEKIQASTERNPYQFVPNTRRRIIEYPIFYTIAQVLRSVKIHLKLSTESLDNLTLYLANYYSRLVRSNRDIETSLQASNEFMELHPFYVTPEKKRSTSLSSRVKKAFQIQILRLGWIQSQTSLLQDALVLGALYIVVLFPSVNINGEVSIEYLIIGLLVISLPIFIGLTALGWYYDKKLKMWGPDWLVREERNPYSYVPSPTYLIKYLPFFYSILSIMWNIFDHLGTDKSEIDRLFEYLEKYRKLIPSRNEDIEASIMQRREFATSFSNLSRRSS